MNSIRYYWETTRFSVRNFYVNHFHSFGRFFYGFFGTISIFILIFEYGFYFPESYLEYLELASFICINFLYAYELSTFLFSNVPILEHVKIRKVEAFIVVSITIQKLFESELIAFLGWEKLGANEASLLFLSINQIFLVFSNFARLIRNSKTYFWKGISPSFLFVFSFASIIAIGTALLLFPKAHKHDLQLIDVVFTVVSATCVTGLSTISITESFTTTGLIILIFLMQIGGLGIMTLTSFFAIFLTGKASVNDKVLMKDILSQEALGKVSNLLRTITTQTIVIELVGAFVLYWNIPSEMNFSTSEKIFHSIFHSVSAFCNAGFSTFPNGFVDLKNLQAHTFLSCSMFLITFGGLGFPVIRELAEVFLYKQRKGFSNTTILVLQVSLILFVFGSISYFFLERNFSLKNLSLFEQIFHSIFYSVTTRTAGFNTLEMDKMGIPITFLSLFLMWVGASPISTGGGIKTTTLALAFLQIVNQLKGKNRIEFRYKVIAPESVNRAGITIVLSLFAIFLAIFGLVIFETENFLDISFEVVSAYGTVGLSRGITATLETSSKIILCFVMFVGRVGVLSFLLAFAKPEKQMRYEYPKDFVVVG